MLLRNFTSVEESDSWVEHTYEVKNQILKLKANLIEAENNQREILLSKGDTSSLPISKTQKSTFKEIETLKRLTVDNLQQQQLIKKLRETVSLWYQGLYATINDKKDGELDHFSVNLNTSNANLQQVMLVSDDMEKQESKLLKIRKDKKDLLQNTAPRYLGVILFVSCIFQLGSFTVITRAYRRRKSNEQLLEKKVKELNASNAELEQIAFVASHDLQEPLRKIRTFSDKLTINYKTSLNEEGRMIVEKISLSSQRVQELLNDLINYTTITENAEEPTQVDLSECLEKVLEELVDAIRIKGATIKAGWLPVVAGHRNQLAILFYNLLDNSLKFSKAGKTPVITVSSQTVSGKELRAPNMFSKITIEDNGIGFEEEFNKKLFVIFKRLHASNSEIPGKGIGLAICRKIMTNHNGYIAAEGKIGEGAAFHLYFPLQELD